MEYALSQLCTIVAHYSGYAGLGTVHPIYSCVVRSKSHPAAPQIPANPEIPLKKPPFAADNPAYAAYPSGMNSQQ